MFPSTEVDVITNNLPFHSLLPEISPAAMMMMMTKILMMMLMIMMMTMVMVKISIAKNPIKRSN